VVPAVELAVLEGPLEGVEPLGSHLGLGVGEANVPVDAVDHAVMTMPGSYRGRPHRLVAVDAAGAVEFDSLESERLDEIELLLDPTVDLDHAELDRLFELRPGRLVGEETVCNWRGHGEGCRPLPRWLGESRASVERGHCLFLCWA